jgi:hypothetical protein
MKRFFFAVLLSLATVAVAAPMAAGEPAAGKEHAYGFTFSGYFKADFAYDDARVSSGNYLIKVLPEDKNGVASMTARESRIGFNFWWNDEERNIRTDAKLEFDFYGLGVSPASLNSMENKAAPMLRHAYLKVSRDWWAVTAGQTSDIISPLVPTTVNYTVCWGIGNIGYRRPQFRFSATHGSKDDLVIKADVGVSRTIGSDIDGDKVDDGADAVTPSVQGRIGVAFDFGEVGNASLGVSGHYGQEAYTWRNEAADRDDEQTIDSWSFCGDLKMKLTKNIAISGEFFFGSNLGSYLGGVLQGVNPHTREAISATGGWGQLSITPSPRHTLNFGYGLDNPKNDHVLIPIGEDASPLITQNSIFFWNWIYTFTSNVSAMLEVSSAKTIYVEEISSGSDTLLGDSSYENFRIQVALKAAIK